MSTFNQVVTRIAVTFWGEGWQWKTFRGVKQPEPFIPNASHIEDYLQRAIDEEWWTEPGSHPRGRIALNKRHDGRIEVYLRMGTLDK